MTLDKVLNFWVPVSSFENEDHNLPQRVVVRSERFKTCKGLQTMPFNKRAVRAVLIDRRHNNGGPGFSNQKTSTQVDKGIEKLRLSISTALP